MKRILVVLANFGDSQLQYLERVIQEYLTFTNYKVDIYCHTDIPLEMDHVKFKVITRLNDWNDLPFTTRQTIYDLKDDYDIYIYSENDHLITQKNIDSWIKANDACPQNIIPGFIQIEKYKEGYFYPAYHAHYKWDENSVIKIGEYIFALFTNLHQATFVLTKEQLHQAISKLDFLHDVIRDVPYNQKPRAGTDVYTSAGFIKLIPISHFDDFLIWHLPNKYKDHLGTWDHIMRNDIEKLLLKT